MRSADDQAMLEKIKNAPKSARVVGRGMVTVDVREVMDTPQMRIIRARAATLVDPVWRRKKV